jgi:hypothetical protein
VQKLRVVLRGSEGKRKKEKGKKQQPRPQCVDIGRRIPSVNEPSKTAAECSPGRKPGDQQQKEVSEPAKRATD